MRMNPPLDRTISATEVSGWFQPSNDLKPADYEAIAQRLTSMSWPGDAPPPPDAPSRPKSSKDEPDRWWDFDAAFQAAQLLLDSLPAMKMHWKGLAWSSKTADGYPAICAIETPLRDALEFIQFPFGPYKRKSRVGKKVPKVWHLPSVLIANVIIETLLTSGRPVGGIARNSVVARVVHRALVRMGYPDPEPTPTGAIGMHLTRWHKKYGLSHRAIADDDYKARGPAM